MIDFICFCYNNLLLI